MDFGWGNGYLANDKGLYFYYRLCDLVMTIFLVLGGFLSAILIFIPLWICYNIIISILPDNIIGYAEVQGRYSHLHWRYGIPRYRMALESREAPAA